MADSGEKEEGEKEFEASEQRKKQARQEGNVAQSKETNTLAVVIGLLVAAYIFWSLTSGQMAGTLFGFFHHAEAYSNDIFKGGGGQAERAMMSLVVAVMVPLLVLVAILLTVLVITRAFTFSTKKIELDMKKLSPVENFKKKYGPQGLIDFARDGAKMIVAGVIATVFLFTFARDYYGSGAIATQNIGGFAFAQVIKLIIIYAIFQFILAAIDFPIQRRMHAERLKMTREEMKKELKQSEGDPLLKQQRRQKATKVSQGTMLKNVEGSTVIMVNPTHYAVALKWDPEEHAAPIVVAKGVDHMAARIREIAIENKIPIYSDPPSTRSIYAAVDVDQPILQEHFAAVAAAVQYVDRIKAAMARE
ncbi:MAG: EscU/YscU/HrcU family type III secretion system export apparatus switch protein [Henriciella sp.]